MIDIAVGLVALALLLHRARSFPSLRPVAAAVAAFALLDAARLAWSPWVAAGVWPWSWLDVLVVGAMPGLWMGLLQGQPLAPRRFGAGYRERRGVEPVAEHGSEEEHGRDRPVLGAPDVEQPGVVDVREAVPESVLEDGVADHAPILPRLAPLVLCLLYASALLAARHWPPVREHWAAWLQAPRLAGLAMALWVVVRGKDESPEEDPPQGANRSGLRGAAWWLPAPGRPLRPRSAFPVEGRNFEATGPKIRSQGSHLPRSPSTTIGLILAGSAGVLVVVGGWADWAAVVRPGAAMAWIAVAIVAVMAME